MLSKSEAEKLQSLLRLNVRGNAYTRLKNEIDNLTDEYAPGGGTDVIADGPDISSKQMLNEAARALGWRTDWAGGNSPITWDLVLEEIRKLRNKTP